MCNNYVHAVTVRIEFDGLVHPDLVSHVLDELQNTQETSVAIRRITEVKADAKVTHGFDTKHRIRHHKLRCAACEEIVVKAYYRKGYPQKHVHIGFWCKKCHLFTPKEEAIRNATLETKEGSSNAV